MSVLVYIENTEGLLKKSAFEAASYARDLAAQLGTTAVALSIGNVSSDTLQKLSNYGIPKVVRVDTTNLATFVNQAYASIIATVAKSEQAHIVVLSNTFSGKAVAPRVAVKLEAALATGVLELPSVSGDSFDVKRAVFSNKAIASVSLQAATKVLSINPNTYPATEQVVDVTIEDYTPDLPVSDFSTTIKEIVRASDKISLPEAEIVVSAGRGLKGPENWPMIEELAAVLGAATACSKPVSDTGWRPHAEHVGQTGITISPNLYIAIGISGAIQHLAGVSASKTIVVINKDPEAPFFKVADYGIVGDAFVVVPQLIEALKTYKMTS
ncbi:electron transfer flavoprotein subunit alpha/FixB family protein [Sphingobacterium sp. SGG-5]|uniref:electron transfer flavoprotein subunit alpha/FixB family protein n=1 Tax=Sphingobacterium sp. SGG-5 TaxID=2710881 RepID=UPI0013EBBBFB|nr:electron transfer flavoprotein subunit alpha/FixB family protein [Sphingobacterium sp. SGG-5]NGM62901.1 electron transfer flavoprotein subunit alpha/FixB family protein [Sphingobacterium sp. SGG-5]